MADNISYRVMAAGDMDAVKCLLYNSFFQEEPLGHSLEITPRECSVYIESLVPYAYSQSISIVAVCNETSKIVGCRLSIIEDKQNDFCVICDENNPDHIKTTKIITFLKSLHTGINVYETYGVTSFLHFQTLCVLKNYSGRGIGKKLVEENIKVAKNKGIRIAIAEVTGKFSQRLYEKLGFDVLSTVYYSNYLDEYGNQVFTNTGIHDCAKLVGKRI